MNKKLAISILLNLILFGLLTKRHFHKVNTAIYNSAIFETKYPKSTIDDDTFVLFTFGQSKSANTAKDDYQPKHDVYNYYNGDILKAKEPLRGCNGNGGISVWTRVADKLIEAKACKKVVIIPIGRGGTPIEFWSKGEGFKLLESTLQQLQKDNIKITHISWDQGEANNGNSKNYKEQLEFIKSRFRVYNQDAPFYCGIATYQPDSNFEYGIDRELQNIQKSFIQENDDVFPGAFSDSLLETYYRYDGQHFSKKGNIKFAELWFKSLTLSN